MIKQDKDFFEGVEKILPYYNQLLKTGKIDFGVIENRVFVGKLFKMLYPNAMMDLSCDTCVKNYLHYLVAYYEAEYPKYIKSQEIKEVEVVPVEIPLKPKRKSRKNAK